MQQFDDTVIAGTHFKNHSIDAELVLSKLNDHLLNDPIVDVSVLFVAHGMNVEDPLLDKSDAILHLMNGYCANHSTNACAEVLQDVNSPVKMAIAVTEIILDSYSQGQLSSEHLWSICYAVGIRPDRHQLESTSLVNKLKLGCKDLQLLLNCTGLEMTFGVIEGLRK